MTPQAEQAVRTMLDMLDVDEVRVVHLRTEDAATYARQAGYLVTARVQANETVYDVRLRVE
ncbi:MAG TPA: hypothetical protein VFC00_16865 [Micromonosporaceae bacterium]|nr:hypothetical protein [Micromonosporaceae bacterium]